MNKVLITGGAGFIGHALATALLAQGYEIHILDNLSRGRRDKAMEQLLSRGGTKLFERNLLDAGALEGLCDDYAVIVHFAAILGVQNVLDRPYQTLRDNILLQAEIIQFAQKQRSLQRFIFASTSEVYAGSLRYMDMPVPTPEEFPLAITPLEEPRTSYMLSKIYGEAMLQHSSVPFTIVRPHNIYGPRMGMSHVVPQLLKKAHDAPSGTAIDVFSVDHRRSFCFIDDAVEMLKRCMETPAALNQVLNLGAEGPEVSMEQVAEIVIATVGKPLRIEPKPATAGSPARRAPKMTRMTETINYKAQVSLEEGVRRTYDWYREFMFS